MAITTVGDIITSALSKVLVNNAQDTLSSADTQLAFDALGVLIDALGIERLACYALTTTAHPLTGGTGSYTIGTGGAFNVDRPARIENAFVRLSSGSNSVDYPVEIIPQAQWDTIRVKDIAGIPRKLFYDTQYPLGTIWLYPEPLLSDYTLYLNSYLPIATYTSTADAIDLPPGYKRMLIHNLAVEIAPDFGVNPDQTVIKIANESKRLIKRINTPDPVMTVDPAIATKRGTWNIVTGGY